MYEEGDGMEQCQLQEHASVKPAIRVTRADEGVNIIINDRQQYRGILNQFYLSSLITISL